MKIIRLVDKESDFNVSAIGEYVVSNKQFERAYNLIEELVGKFYKNWDYYTDKYGGLFDFIEYKLDKAHIKWEAPQVEEISY